MGQLAKCIFADSSNLVFDFYLQIYSKTVASSSSFSPSDSPSIRIGFLEDDGRNDFMSRLLFLLADESDISSFKIFGDSGKEHA